MEPNTRGILISIMDGALNERQMAELGAYSFDRITNLRERQRDGERQLRLLTCQREGAGRVEI